ncbi:MAG: ribose-phosphate diphosphokinase [Alphaproteobacteria bacterium]
MASAGCRLHAFPDGLPFARALGRAAGAGVRAIDLHRFPDGESLVRVGRPAGRDAVVVRPLDSPNEKLVEVVLAADALRRAGARSVTLVAPYLAYMRQDAVFAPGQPVSQRAIATMLGRAFDRVLAVEAHLHRVASLAEIFPVPALSISASPAIARWIARSAGDPGETVLVGPDQESEASLRAVAEAAGGLRWVVGRKLRRGDRDVRVSLPRVRAEHAVVVDDVASSGRTIAATAERLRRSGVRRVDAVVVHAVFARGALSAMRAAGVRRVVSCDTIEHRTNAIPVAGLLASALGGA